jgi:hypothetical protein
MEIVCFVGISPMCDSPSPQKRSQTGSDQRKVTWRKLALVRRSLSIHIAHCHILAVLAGRGRRMRFTVVVITHERRQSLLRTLGKLRALPSQPAVIVVDNASADGSAYTAALGDSRPGRRTTPRGGPAADTGAQQPPLPPVR